MDDAEDGLECEYPVLDETDPGTLTSCESAVNYRE